MDLKPTSKLLGWSKKYLTSCQGILNICEIVLCYASTRLLRDTCRPAYSSSVGGFVGSASETYFYVFGWTSLILTSVLLFSFTISHGSYVLAERTVLLFMFWATASISSCVTSLVLLVFTSSPNSVEAFGYSHKLAAIILGFISSLLYGIGAIRSYKACKSSWSY
ncbi:uncharacterized protein LOC129232407 [Uloborus diversus]|uniref:uncharacterized protein LOC129232407 n=1 Tax=Uloborus diversus TaxID=327109 RepID=UPI0024091EB1|nr:uncharacterized protein LOC129232407 [Uloborus diversus]XP_054722527.1 uncharacterized protein LOC129232407 [Uloborus diversus]